MADFRNRPIDSVDEGDFYSIDMIAKEMGLGTQRTRQLIDIALEKKAIPKLIKKKGAKNLYHPDMVGRLKAAYEGGKIVEVVRRRNEPGGTHSRSLKHAKLVINVPVFDEQDAQILLKRFGSEGKIAEYLRERLDEAYKPARNELAKLEAEFEEKRRRILEGRN